MAQQQPLPVLMRMRMLGAAWGFQEDPAALDEQETAIP